MNLLENALAYSPADEPVQVVVEDTGAEIVTRVIDRGGGITARSSSGCSSRSSAAALLRPGAAAASGLRSRAGSRR